MGRLVIAHVLSVLLLSAALAGCADNESTRGQEVAKRTATRQNVAANLTGIEQRIDQRTVNPSEPPTVSDWFVLAGSAGPTGNLTGFRLVLPVASIIGMRFAGSTGIVMEVAPIVVGTSTIKEWCLTLYREQESHATLAGGGGFESTDLHHPERWWAIHCATSETRTVRDAVAGDNNSQQAAAVAPFYMIVNDILLAELQNTYVVLAATAETQTEFGVALRFLPQYPSGYFPGTTNPSVQPTGSLDAFLADRGATKPRSVPVLGRGDGLALSFWVASHGLTPTRNTTVGTYKAYSGVEPPAEVVDGHPAAAAWNFNLSLEHPSDGGWSFVYGGYFSYCGTGRYTASATLHGASFLARSVIAQHLICGAIYGGLAQLLLFGTSQYMFSAGGSGASQLNYELLVAGAIHETITLFHVTYGTPLDVLIKLPARDARWMENGLLGNVPP